MSYWFNHAGQVVTAGRDGRAEYEADQRQIEYQREWIRDELLTVERLHIETVDAFFDLEDVVAAASHIAENKSFNAYYCLTMVDDAGQWHHVGDIRIGLDRVVSSNPRVW
jgi:FlaG/FlaF family flagellin (archaellin)